MTYQPIQYRWNYTRGEWEVFSIWHRTWEPSQHPSYYTEGDIRAFYEGHRHLVTFED